MAIVPSTTFPLSASFAGDRLGDGQDAASGTITVRSAKPEDAARVLVCAREVFQTSPFVLTSPGEFNFTEEQERELIQKFQDHPRQVMLIAEHGDRVIGILALTQNTAKRKMRHSVLLGMSVLLAFRGRRVGTALMHVAIEWAMNHPELKLVTLDVYVANKAGRALYERFGFKTTGILPGGLMHDDGTVWDQMAMHREV
jgi:RimJ/RimL family protein N-acetyltransferase